MRYHCLIAMALTAVCIGWMPGLAAETRPPAQHDSLLALIDVLTDKGLLSAEEAQDLRQRAAEAGKPAPSPVAEKPKYPTVKTKVRLETRFSSVQEDEDQPYFGSRDDQYGGDGFAVRRARLYFMGDLSPETGYKVQYQSDWGHTNPNLHVAQMEWRGWDFADLIVGQLQTPFGYEIVLSDAYLLCTDRAAVSSFLPADKDIGILLSSKNPLPGGIRYDLFVGNVSGKYLANPSHNYLWIARLAAQPTPDIAVGASVSTNRDTTFSPYQARFLKKNGDPYALLPAYTAADADETAWETDVQWRRGPTALWAEYIRARIATDDGRTVTADGCYLDLHRFLPYAGARDKLEAVLGYQQFDANRRITDRYDLTAYTLGLNYHIRGGRYGPQRCQEMIRVNYIWNREAADETDNDKFVVQYQTWF